LNPQEPNISNSADHRQLNLLRERLESISMASEILRAMMASDSQSKAVSTLLAGLEEIVPCRRIVLFEAIPEALAEIGRTGPVVPDAPCRLLLERSEHPAVISWKTACHRIEESLAPLWEAAAKAPAILLPFEGRLGSDPTNGPSASHLLWIDAPVSFPPPSSLWDLLVSITGQAGALLSGFRLRDDLRRTYEALHQANHQLQKDIDRARRIQEGLVPGGNLSAPHILAASRYLPAAKVSGDSFDLFPLDPKDPSGKQALLVADVSGHGISAAMVMSMFKVLLRRSLIHAATLESALEEINQDLLAQVQGLHFVTVFLAIFDPQEWSLLWTSAGHCPQILLRRDGGLQSLEASGLFLGAFDDPQLRGGRLDLSPGDRLLLHTDGIVEAAAEDGEMFGFDRLCQHLRGCQELPPAASLDSMLRKWRDFVGAEPVEDDVTLLLVEFA
jgi:serine phosphatase RsbU (regulator of sigma subunit)